MAHSATIGVSLALRVSSLWCMIISSHSRLALPRLTSHMRPLCTMDTDQAAMDWQPVFGHVQASQGRESSRRGHEEDSVGACGVWTRPEAQLRPPYGQIIYLHEQARLAMRFDTHPADRARCTAGPKVASFNVRILEVQSALRDSGTACLPG